MPGMLVGTTGAMWGAPALYGDGGWGSVSFNPRFRAIRRADRLITHAMIALRQGNAMRASYLVQQAACTLAAQSRPSFMPGLFAGLRGDQQLRSLSSLGMTISAQIRSTMSVPRPWRFQALQQAAFQLSVLRSGLASARMGF